MVRFSSCFLEVEDCVILCENQCKQMADVLTHCVSNPTSSGEEDNQKSYRVDSVVGYRINRYA